MVLTFILPGFQILVRGFNIAQSVDFDSPVPSFNICPIGDSPFHSKCALIFSTMDKEESIMGLMLWNGRNKSIFTTKKH